MTLIDRTHRAGGSPQASAPLLRVSDVRKSYATPQGPIPVLKGVDLTLAAGESLALLGESGTRYSNYRIFRRGYWPSLSIAWLIIDLGDAGLRSA